MHTFFTVFFIQLLAALGEREHDEPSGVSFVQVALEKRRRCSPEDMRQPFAELLKALETGSASPSKAAEACTTVWSCVDTTKKTSQDAWAAVNAIEVAIQSMRKFHDKKLQISCATAVETVILFNREHGLKAGALGGLNLTLALYAAHMDDPEVTSLGGVIGAYFDYVDENRQIARELGGIHLLTQNIRNNFHGKYSTWAFEPVKQSLYGLSSGTWRNQDVCAQEDIVPLHVQLIAEHGAEPKIAEETLQCVKAMTFGSVWRKSYAENGLFEALVKVLKDRPTDQGAVSLVCSSSAILIGPSVLTTCCAKKRKASDVRELAFDASIQKAATEAGLVNALIRTATSNNTMEQLEHNFSFDIDLAYDVQGTCYDALRSMAMDNAENRAAIAAKLPQSIDKKWSSLNAPGKTGACRLLQELNVARPHCPGS